MTSKTPSTPSISPRDWLSTAKVLSEALPFMRRYAGRTVVVKYGGHAMGDERLAALFAADMVLLKQVGIHPVVVHGGGPQIGEMLKKLQIQSEFIDGLRVTDKATVEVVEMVLAGAINKQIVSAIQAAGGQAVGLCGKDGNLIQARKLEHRQKTDSNIEKVLDLGFVGEPMKVNTEVLRVFNDTKFIPVIAPVGIGEDGQTYNINADTAAGAIAGALNASRLLMLTDVSGVLDKDKKLIDELTLADVDRLIREGTISGGMIPKVETCVQAVEGGVDAAVILDGRGEHAVLLEIFTEHGAGTLIRKG
ncbi:MAG: acetylglutamate kinase [Oceanibaculum sp.]